MTCKREAGHSVCRRAAIHNLRATSLNGTNGVYFEKGRAVVCRRATEKRPLEQSLWCVFYITLSSVLPFQPRLVRSQLALSVERGRVKGFTGRCVLRPSEVSSVARGAKGMHTATRPAIAYFQNVRTRIRVEPNTGSRL